MFLDKIMKLSDSNNNDYSYVTEEMYNKELDNLTKLKEIKKLLKFFRFNKTLSKHNYDNTKIHLTYLF